MKSILLILTICVSSFAGSGCKTKKETTTTTSVNTTKGAYVGKVSHKFSEAGCKIVIVIPAADQTEELTIIPIGNFDKAMDVDGLSINFDYHPLKVKQPAGCGAGIPAEVTNISKAAK